MELIFRVNHQLVQREDMLSPMSLSKNYLRAKFIFESEEWEGLAKTAIFKSPYTSAFYVILDEDNSCAVPYEVTAVMGSFTVSLFAGDLITTNFSTVFVGESGYIEGEAPEPPEEDVYNQLMLKYSEAITEVGKKANKTPFRSLERLRSYAYKVTFDEIPAEIPGNDNSGGMGCSSYVNAGKLYRNLDWTYSDIIAFKVVCNGFEGMAFSRSLVEGNLDDEKVGQLPYHLLDGHNDAGIMVSTHVLYNDWDWHGTGNTPLYKLPYLILSTINSLDNFATVMAPILADVKAYPEIEDEHFLLQFLVTDGTTSYAILPPENETGSYVVVNITSNPKLANFRWVPDSEVVRSGSVLQDRPMGIERWNMMPCELSALKYTLAYEQPTRLSEFIGVNGTDKDSTDEELMAIYNVAHEYYLNRTRQSGTWQTMYSVVYSPEGGMERLNFQENFVADYH